MPNSCMLVVMMRVELVGFEVEFNIFRTLEFKLIDDPNWFSFKYVHFRLRNVPTTLEFTKSHDYDTTCNSPSVKLVVDDNFCSSSTFMCH